MICHYCRSENSDDDHRCQRCGRRLQSTQPLTPAQAMPTVPYSRSAAAHALAPSGMPENVASPSLREAAPEETAPQRSSVQYQRALFSNRELPQVVQLERPSVAPSAPEPAVVADKQKTRPRRPAVIPGQQKFEFPAHASRQATAAPGSLIDCDALTANLFSRAAAFAFDATMVLAASAIFLGVARFSIKTLPFDRLGLAMLAGAVVLLAVLYKVLWCIGNGDSPGLRWAKLRLINFDGRRPGRRQRFQRAASGIVSFAAMGLGLLWALVDEEALTWHDHISKCFPTPD